MTVLHAGEIGRLDEVSTVNATDDLIVLRDGSLYRVDADFLPIGADNIVRTTDDYEATGFEDIILAIGTLTITLTSPATADKTINIRNKTGAAATVTIATVSGTTEVSSLTNGQATTLAPDNTDNEWVEVT